MPFRSISDKINDNVKCNKHALRLDTRRLDELTIQFIKTDNAALDDYVAHQGFDRQTVSDARWCIKLYDLNVRARSYLLHIIRENGYDQFVKDYRSCDPELSCEVIDYWFYKSLLTLAETANSNAML